MKGVISFFERFALLLMLVVVIIFFSVNPATPQFLSVQNLQNLLINQALLVLLAVATTLPLVAGQIDLSVGPSTALTALLTAGMMSKLGLPLVVAILVSIIVGIIVGLINGVLIARIGISSIVATLGMSSIILAAALVSILPSVPAYAGTPSKGFVLRGPMPLADNRLLFLPSARLALTASPYLVLELAIFLSIAPTPPVLVSLP
jgi:ribose/xylose/arabinose/galactoside ABC-type transport system permease subunit